MCTLYSVLEKKPEQRKKPLDVWNNLHATKAKTSEYRRSMFKQARGMNTRK